MPKPRENLKCNLCSKSVGDDQQGLLCDKCNTWKHRECISMPQRVYVQLSKTNDPWYCDDCKGKKQDKGTAKDVSLADIMDKLNDMEKKYDKVFQRLKEQEEINVKLETELKEIKQVLNKRDQKELMKNVVIQGVPVQPNENLKVIVKKIADHLGTQIDGSITAFRLGEGNQNCPPIKVVFEEQKDKNMLITSKKKLTLTSKDVGFMDNNKIYINHDLTKVNLKLMSAARIFKKDNNYKYLWLSTGNIFLRKDDKSKVIVLENEEQLREGQV